MDSENKNYTEIAKSRNGLDVPVKDGIFFHSKYDPEKEASSFAESFPAEKSFFIVGGLCGAYHIKRLLEKTPDSFILVIENSSADIEFLKQIPCVKQISEQKNVKITTPENLFNEITENYIPAIHGGMKAAFLRSWENIFPQNAEKCRLIIKEAVKEVSRDFSVQSRFGKTWQKNIMKNLSFFSSENSKNRMQNDENILKKISGQTGKTAAIIGAGPSLDSSIKKIIENRSEYFVIATDTAYLSLLRRKIFCDAVVSIDGQNISNNHFLKHIDKNTLFVMDLCASSAAVEKIKRSGAEILFFESGHPLAVFAALYKGKRAFFHLETGGTVTVSAFDFAKKAGFNKIEFFGADFSYESGKPYARGTYLDDIFSLKSSRLNPCEKQYSALCYRTELFETKNGKFTTEILDSYRNALENYTEKLNSTEKSPKSEEFFSKNTVIPFDKKDFFEFLKNELLTLQKNGIPEEKTPAFLSLLPLISNLEQRYDFSKSFELALNKTLLYTIKL